MEHWELLCSGGYGFFWDSRLFRPSTDTFLLSSLPKLRPGLRVCDLGSGTGLLSVLLLQRQPDLIVTGVELQEDAVRLAERSAVKNGLEDRLSFRQGDLRKIREIFPAAGFDLVVCNPPYYPPDSGKTAAEEAVRSARSETACTLREICSAAAYLLPWGGRFCLIHKPERLADLFCALRAAALEPKRLRAVCRDPCAPPSLVMLEARRGGRPGLTMEAPFFLRTAAGTPAAELDAVYFRTREDKP